MMEFKDDPVNKMSVKEYNAMLIQEKRDQLSGARHALYKAMKDIENLETELINLIVDSR